MNADKSDNYGYSKRLQPLAHNLHRNMTKAEASLWKYALKAKQIKGYQFRRQRPVLQYIADFMCKELKLIIEVDGITHHSEEQVKYDNLRTTDLKNAGFTVIRFKDEDVLKNMNGIIFQIEMKIEELEKL